MTPTTFHLPRSLRVLHWDTSYQHNYSTGLRPIACRDCGFESRRSHGCLFCECYVVSGRSLRRADLPSRGVLPTVVCRVRYRDLKNEAVLARAGLLRERERELLAIPITTITLLDCVTGYRLGQTPINLSRTENIVTETLVILNALMMTN